MKKVMIAALTVVMSVTGGITVLAAPSIDGTCQGNGQYYVDENGDGICDNYNESKGKGQRFGNARGNATNQGLGCLANGICRKANGEGVNFVDADQDGICDNQGTGLGQNQGTGLGKKRGNGRGQNRGNCVNN